MALRRLAKIILFSFLLLASDVLGQSLDPVVLWESPNVIRAEWNDPTITYLCLRKRNQQQGLEYPLGCSDRSPLRADTYQFFDKDEFKYNYVKRIADNQYIAVEGTWSAPINERPRFIIRLPIMIKD